jgi:molybdopterin adenylyltransferase
MRQIRVGILTISDRTFRGEREDLSGPALSQAVLSQGWLIADQALVPDEKEQISKALKVWAKSDKMEVILTTGGTGFSPRDVTPEATLLVLERLAPGLAEFMRLESLKKTPHAALSRSVAGIASKTLIVNLPGSPTAAVENLTTILPLIPHAVELLQEDTSSEAGHLFSHKK